MQLSCSILRVIAAAGIALLVPLLGCGASPHAAPQAAPPPVVDPPVPPSASSPPPAEAPPPPGQLGGSVHSAFKGTFSDDPVELDYVANVAELQILNGVGPSKLRAVHAVNPGDVVYTYQKLAGIHGPDTSPPDGDPGWSQVVAQGLLWNGPSGHPVTQVPNGWYYVDILDPAKRAAWVGILTANVEADFAAGYDAVLFDDAAVIDSSLIDEYPSSYSDSSYYQAISQVAAAMRAALPGRRILLNGYTGIATPENRGLDLLASADGLFFEGFSMRTSSRFFDHDRYLQQIGDFSSVLADGKVAVAVDYGASGDLERRMWSLASYLLVGSERAYRSFAGTDLSTDLQPYPEDRLAIGAAAGDVLDGPGGLVTRDYAGATVLVNPTENTVEWPLDDDSWETLVLAGGGAFPDTGTLSWAPVGAASLSLASDTAAIIRHP